MSAVARRVGYFERSTARRDLRVDPSRHPARENTLFYNNVVFYGAMKRHFYRRHPRHYSSIKIISTRSKFIGSKFNLHDHDYWQLGQRDRHSMMSHAANAKYSFNLRDGLSFTNGETPVHQTLIYAIAHVRIPRLQSTTK